MAIRQVISRSIKDGEIVDADTNASFSSGSGFFQGENGDTSQASKKGDIFRVNEATLNTSVTIASGDNASCAGPLTVHTSGTVNLTVLGNLTIV
jgi:hypothetical protein